MRNKYVYVGALVLILLVVVVILRSHRKQPVQFGCVEETQKIESINDRFMAGVLESGKTYEVLIGFYNCNPPQKGDVVLYRFSQSADPVIKIIRGVGGDKFEIKADKKHGAWNLLINNDLVMFDDEPYFFGGRTKPTLSLYEKDRKNILGPEELILLSNVPPGMEDSGIFGLVSKSDIMGKVKIK